MGYLGLGLCLALMFLSGNWYVACGQSDVLSFGRPVFEVKLPADYNDYIYCDSYGYIWISSINGVYRSSGHGELKSYLRKKEGTSSSASLIHSNFFEDRFGDIYVASYDGINKYNRNEDDFESFKITNNAGNTISEGYKIIHLQQDTILWFKAEENIYKYSLNTAKVLRKIPSEGMFFCKDEYEDGSLKRIYACFYVTPGLQIIDFDEDGRLDTVTWRGAADYKVMDCLVEHDSLVWLFGNNGVIGLNPYDPDHWDEADGLEAGDEVQHGVSIDSTTILLANRLNQKAILDKESLEIEYTEEIYPNALYAAYLDPNELLWLKEDNTNKLSAFWVEKGEFNLIRPMDVDTSSARLEFFLEDSQLRRWFVSKTKGVFLYDKGNASKRHFLYSEEDGELHAVHNLTEDQAGKIWAIGNNHIYIFNEINMAWEVVISKPNFNLNSLINLSDNVKLVSSLQGIYKLRLEKEGVSWTKFDSQGCIKDGDIMYMFEGKDATSYTWTTSDFWVFKYDATTDELAFDDYGLSDIVYDIYEDPVFDTVWIGTASGLLAFDKNRKVLEDALPENTLTTEIRQVDAISRDEYGNLWLATQDELRKYDVDTKLLSRYDLGKEVLIDNVNPSSGSVTSEKNICFVSSKGLLEFDPLSIKPYPKLPNIEVIDFKKNDTLYQFKVGRTGSDSIEQFRHYENSFSFNLKTVGHYFPDNNDIYYRLKGSDGGFKKTKDGGSVSYNLGPGMYVLEAYAVNPDGLEPEKKEGKILLHFEVETPIWKRWWFILISLIFGLALLYGLYEIRLEQQYQKQQLIFNSQSEERNRIAGELHDEIGSGLSSIRLLSDTSILKTPDYSKIYKLTFELQEKMSDIIWAMNVDKDTLESLIGVIYEHADAYLEPNHLTLDIRIPRKLPEYELGGEKRRNILLVVKEILHNVVKHAKAKNVLLKIEVENDILLLLIADDGIGFDPEIRKSKSNGLRNIRKRIESMYGKLNIDGSDGGKFTIEIPLKSQAEKESALLRIMRLWKN